MDLFDEDSGEALADIGDAREGAAGEVDRAAEAFGRAAVVDAHGHALAGREAGDFEVCVERVIPRGAGEKLGVENFTARSMRVQLLPSAVPRRNVPAAGGGRRQQD